MNRNIKFGTDGWRGIIAKDFTLDNLSRVCEGVRLWLFKYHSQPSVAIGYDCRFNGALFARFVASYLGLHHCRCFLSTSFVSTPMLSLATLQKQCHAGIMITASHNPPEYSGFKIKGPFGGPIFTSAIAEIEALIPSEPIEIEDCFEQLLENRTVEYYDMEALYLNYLRQSFDLKAIAASGISTAYDAMFGSGQRIFRKLFPKAELVRCEYNPSFLGQAPEPIARNLGTLQKLIQQKHIQLGLATDGDADRIGLFDENGNFVDSHHVLLLLIHYLAHYQKKKGKVVCTFSCSSKIAKLAAHYGLPYQVTKIGFKYIGEIMAQERVLVAGEESGGIAIEGHIPERDGIYVGLTLMDFMVKTQKKLSELIQEIYAIVGSFAVERVDLHISEEQKKKVLDRCAQNSFSSIGLYNIIKVESLDGFKYYFSEESWVMLRSSGTEPVLRIYAEAPTAKEAQDILAAAQAVFLT
ncbi:MAG: phosphoglucomutase/phosphomannomutase family protein [Bacteroidia bacterium]|nr:phosphoglucomutase/phosphomannomutase family protein [Bacteroidia bacterium]MDW8157985.1 phosphoglucomutase/phosphomannomutase family protein [Bacteroidia bacterium]